MFRRTVLIGILLVGISGVAMARLPVPIQCTLVEEAYLECARLRIDGLPMFDSPSCTGVAGTLCASEGQGDIGFAAFPSNAASIKLVCFISTAYIDHQVWGSHRQEAKRGPPSGHRIPRNEGAMLSLLLSYATPGLSLIAG